MTDHLAERAERAVADLESAGQFVRGPYFEAVVTRALREAVTAVHSPWLDRRAAAAHCRCSLTEIDRAARMGFIKRFDRGGTPLFSKTDLNTAIASGRWRPFQTPNTKHQL